MTDITQRAEEVLAQARNKGLMLATAESCTGGLVSAALTEIPGSSDVFDRGFATYSNAAKSELLAVGADIIDRFGAVSPQVAEAMAAGALSRSQASITVSITGIAGPGGGSDGKPVGLVWFGVAQRDVPTRSVERRFGDVGRRAVREKSVETALSLFLDAIEKAANKNGRS